ncbi:MAG: DNA primase [Clostridia bacterium]|nr:DNA primase [Clostridia bacterium]
MAFDSSFLSDLKFRCPIEDVIGSYVSLKRNGSRYTACCPFHNEKTPSFTVFSDTSSYYCFGCGAGGDVITFVMNYENLDYVDAVKQLADRAGLALPEDRGVSDSKKRARERMLEMHKIAAKHYYLNLTAQDNPCMQYLKGRGLDTGSVTRYGLGYAKDSFDDIKTLLLSKGFSLAEMFEAGLVAKSQKNGSYYDKFRNRLMFPVIDIRGNVLAFSGRALAPDQMPKYMNSPETPIYHKGDVLFGLNLAKDKNDGTLILCEGNIDVVMLSQAGFKNAIAPLGTAFTVEQARIIAKYAKTVVVSFDSDSAGQKATAKAIDYLKSQGVTVRVLQMQGAKDPDEYIKKYGKERFANLINRAKTPTEYQMDKLRESYDILDTAQKMEFISKCSDIIAKIYSPVEREIYASNLSKEMDLSPQILKADIERRHKLLVKGERKKDIERRTKESTGADDRVNPQRQTHLLASKAEEMLVVILARNPGMLDFIKERISPQEFVTDWGRKVFEFFVNGLESDPSVQNLSYAEAFNQNEAARIAYLLNTTILSDDPRLQAQDCIDSIKNSNNKKIDATQLSGEELAALIKKEKK